MADKRAKLLSDLCQLGSTHSGISSRSAFKNISDSDLDISDVDESMEAERDTPSEFSDDGSESDDDLEGHLQLLWPRELETLGMDALQSGQFDSAAKYFNMARLEWTEKLAKSLSGGASIELDRAAIMDDWIVSKYIQLAVSRAAFVERSTLVKQFEAKCGCIPTAPQPSMSS